MKKTLWLILIAFVLGIFAINPATAAPAHAGKSAVHQTGKKKHKKHGKKHHKKHKGAKKHRN